MMRDYRNTEFCKSITDIAEKKNGVVELVKDGHPQRADMHTYISDNDSPYKIAFIEAYSGKCAYCGVTIAIAPKRYFEVDHFISKKSKRFNGSKAAAGYIENLVLACHKCNRAKGDLEIPDAAHEYLHPDKKGITDTFIRDEDFYIKLSDEKVNDEISIRFYTQLCLGAELLRLDYLLLNMRGLKNLISESSSGYKYLIDAIDLLQEKRNLSG